MTIPPPLTRILGTQWLWSRAVLLPLAVATFTVPILSIQLFVDSDVSAFRAQLMVRQLANWAPAYPLLAAAIGLLLGVSAWSADHRGAHVYALSLPLRRWQFTAYRCAAGLILLMVPVLTLGVGSTMSALTAEIPLTLRAYPMALTVRFATACAMSFALFFAVSAATPRTAARMLAAAVAVGVAQLLLALFDTGVDLLQPVADLVLDWPGPLEVFGGRWLLIDY